MLVVGLTGSMLTAGAHSLVSGVTNTAMGLLMLIVVIALALGWYRANRPVEEEASTQIGGGLPKGVLPELRLVVLVAAVWHLAFVLAETSHHRYNWEVGGQAAWGSYAPRFWHQGKLVHHLDEPWLSFARDGQPLPVEGEPIRE